MEKKQKRLKSKKRKETEAIEEHKKQLIKSDVVAEKEEQGIALDKQKEIFYKLGNEIGNKFNISRFIYSQRNFGCFLQSLSISLIKCLKFHIFMQILINYK